MQRLAAGQHRVVRHVDDVGDRPHPGRHQPRLQPGRRGADRHVLEHARHEALAAVGLDRHGGALDGTARAGILCPGRRRQSRARRGMDLPRDAVEAEAVRPVGRDLQLEHVRGDRQHLGERGARRETVRGRAVAVGREHHDPRSLDADLQLRLAEDHPRRLDAAQLRLAQPGPVGHDGAGLRDRDRLPCGDVRRAADDLRRRLAAEVDRADAQAVGVGVLLGAQHLPDHEPLDGGHAVAHDALDLGPRQRQPLGQRGRVEAGLDVLVQPAQRDLHAAAPANWRRKRRSLS